MATAATKPNLGARSPALFSNRIVAVNSAPPEFDPARDLPRAFSNFSRRCMPLLTLRRQRIDRAPRLRAGGGPTRERFPITCRLWSPPTIPGALSFLPGARIQRNQMTGPADDADLVVKMLEFPVLRRHARSGRFPPPNAWEHNSQGIKNILEALAGRTHLL